MTAVVADAFEPAWSCHRCRTRCRCWATKKPAASDHLYRHLAFGPVCQPDRAVREQQSVDTTGSNCGGSKITLAGKDHVCSRARSWARGGSPTKCFRVFSLKSYNTSNLVTHWLLVSYIHRVRTGNRPRCFGCVSDRRFRDVKMGKAHQLNESGDLHVLRGPGHGDELGLGCPRGISAERGTCNTVAANQP